MAVYVPQDAHSSAREAAAEPPFSRSSLRLLIYLALAAFWLPMVFGPLNLSLFYLITQDRWLLLAIALLSMLCSVQLRAHPTVLATPNWVRWAGVSGR